MRRGEGIQYVQEEGCTGLDERGRGREGVQHGQQEAGGEVEGE